MKKKYLKALEARKMSSLVEFMLYHGYVIQDFTVHAKVLPGKSSMVLMSNEWSCPWLHFVDWKMLCNHMHEQSKFPLLNIILMGQKKVLDAINVFLCLNSFKPFTFSLSSYKLIFSSFSMNLLLLQCFQLLFHNCYIDLNFKQSFKNFVRKKAKREQYIMMMWFILEDILNKQILWYHWNMCGSDLIKLIISLFYYFTFWVIAICMEHETSKVQRFLDFLCNKMTFSKYGWWKGCE